MKHFLIQISVDNSPVLNYFSKFLTYQTFSGKKKSNNQVHYEILENGLVLVYSDYTTFLDFNDQPPIRDISMKTKILSTLGGLSKIIVPAKGINLTMEPFHCEFDNFFQEIKKYFTLLHENFQLSQDGKKVHIKLTQIEAVTAFLNDFFKRYGMF
ncbi:hypothetical protein NEF87_000178 [Candidatus Lokiarchaeum ossiferum]|uniref:Homing endonuclease LAGLIDADG domain-containing protein n=1 Tax=Candidatus Lokiarchaeum ossiferum TaxID=2951803 RepID=A0ABY6HKR1_9ARCH|nr:hypothetical protein NEF87_000178 [Candidatus Lokiarchaeum sp. B-35]